MHFNSHAHVERDRYIELSTDERKISTHTLTWSVTAFTGLLNIFIRYFNSHAHVERDGKTDEIADILVNFNSHAHVERDATYVRLNFNLSISTHTLTWSVTNRFVHIISRKGISTHTLTWSVTCDSSSVCRYRLFQLTRSRGA